MISTEETDAGATAFNPREELATWPPNYRAKVFATRAIKVEVPDLFPWSRIHEAASRLRALVVPADVVASQEQLLAAMASPDAPGILPPLVDELLLLHAHEIHFEDGAAFIVDHWVRSAGLAHAVARAATPAQLVRDGNAAISASTAGREPFRERAWTRLREHLSGASDEKYRAARAVAERAFVPEATQLMHGLACAFPGERFEREIAELRRAKLGAQQGSNPHPNAALVAAVDPDCVSSLRFLHDETARIALTLVARHGDRVTPYLRSLMARSKQAKAVEPFARALAMVGSVEAISALMSVAEIKVVPPLLLDAARRAPTAAVDVFLAATRSSNAALARRARGLLAQVLDSKSRVPLRDLDKAKRAAAEAIVFGASARATTVATDDLLAPLREDTKAKLPSFFQPATLPPIVLRTGPPLGDVGTERFAKLLVGCAPPAANPEISAVREACTRDSLGAFSFELFQAWLREGAPSKEGWAMRQLAYLGDDHAARELARLIRAWPGENQHKRAVTGLDVLEGMGTDVALMHLYGLSQKGKFKALLDAARSKVYALAERMKLTTAQLGDRLIPNLGLDPDGSMSLLLGNKTYRVGFDEQLRPFVRDGERRLADLPKSRAEHEADLEATATWKALKKDAKTIAGQQLTRFESAMITTRRWPSADFRKYIVEHPLLVHLARRIVWGAYDAVANLVAAFRVAEDRTFADAGDEAWSLPDDAVVGVVHPIELDASVVAAFQQLFGDYQILQPFAQLRREVIRCEGDEARAQWQGVVVSSAKIRKLETRGWRRGEVWDAGIVSSYSGPCGSIELDPGIPVGAPDPNDLQKIIAVSVQADDTPRGRIARSELLRDLRTLTS